MGDHRIRFLPDNREVDVPTGTLILEAMERAGIEMAQPCGGQGRCGRCAVVVETGGVRRRSALRLSAEDLAEGYALACQTLVEADARILIPAQDKPRRVLTSDRSAGRLSAPDSYDPATEQSLRVLRLSLDAPRLDDNADDLSRLRAALRRAGFPEVSLALDCLRSLGGTLRQAGWSPWAAVETGGAPRLVDLQAEEIRPIGLALDIGTTTVSALLVDLADGEVLASAAEYNSQIAFGDDVISRIVFSGRPEGMQHLREAVLETIHGLLERIRERTGIPPDRILKATVAGNTTMVHLFLGIPPESIRLAPYIPAVAQPPEYPARDLGLRIHPQATVDCLPGVASYVGADISAGVLATRLAQADRLTLFLDVGTNGEIVLGHGDWLITCACSAGPAFEGAGVVDGMRATDGAIEEVWIHSQSFEPTYRVIGGGPARGICGSGLISLLAELFVTGVMDRAGNVRLDAATPRVRSGAHGAEYVVAWPEETASGKAIVVTKVDVDNLMRAKAAIYAGFSVLASSVGVQLADVQSVLVAGAFGQYINVEKAIQIGLLPDLPWDRFQFLGNTSVQGAYLSLISRSARQEASAVARKMTYLELSADNTFYDAFTAALFLPHTEIARFPRVAEVWQRENGSSG
jgi:uncharacterized 2Fe-2S/4Fe-4S cluster protein (DUF4445 family)